MPTNVPVRVGQPIARLLANGELHLVVVVVLCGGGVGWAGVAEPGMEERTRQEFVSLLASPIWLRRRDVWV